MTKYHFYVLHGLFSLLLANVLNGWQAWVWWGMAGVSYFFAILWAWKNRNIEL